MKVVNILIQGQAFHFFFLTVLYIEKFSLNLINFYNIQVEFNYLIQWFQTFSEFQKTEFLPILVEYMLQSQAQNGILNSFGQSENVEQKRPMSLFECRVSENFF